jgi:hypothetical protein
MQTRKPYDNRLLNKPQLTEAYSGEFNDFVIDLVKAELQRVPENLQCRRRDLCRAILECNKEDGTRDNIRQQVRTRMRDWTARQSQINDMEQLGFQFIKGKTHYKIRMPNIDYNVAISATTGDGIRAGLETIALIDRTFF